MEKCNGLWLTPQSPLGLVCPLPCEACIKVRNLRRRGWIET